MISDTELVELVEQETPSSYRIPMSIGQERMETDKCKESHTMKTTLYYLFHHDTFVFISAGEPAPTYDIAINPEFYKKCRDNKIFWVFMIAIVIEGVSDKYDKRICPEGYVVLKHRKVQFLLLFQSNLLRFFSINDNFVRL